MSYRLQARMTALLYHYVLDAVLHEEGMETAEPIVHVAMKKWGEWRGLEMRTEHERRGWPLSEGKCGGILAFEGFESLGSDLRFLDLFYKLGLCVASLTHSRRNFFAHGTQQDLQSGGLTTLGKQAVKRMNELGIVIDPGHLNQVGFWEVLELSQLPVIFSHTSPRKFFPLDGEENPRYPGVDLSHGRERLEAIARNGDVVGVIFYAQDDLDEVVANIEYLIDIIGPDHVGLGSDLYGMEKAPKGLEDMSRIPAITKRLVQQGHTGEVILKVLGGNYMRVFEQVWKN